MSADKTTAPGEVKKASPAAEKKTSPAKAKKAAPRATKKAAPGTATKFNPERLMTVLLAPTISEKATHIADKHEQVVFRVMQNATKPEIKAAVELMFKVQVEGVQVSNVKGKVKRFGAYNGRRRHWKKAYVSLKPGQEINFAQEA
jgi:large subunit ribosomal protein L23